MVVSILVTRAGRQIDGETNFGILFPHDEICGGLIGAARDFRPV